MGSVDEANGTHQQCSGQRVSPEFPTLPVCSMLGMLGLGANENEAETLRAVCVVAVPRCMLQAIQTLQPSQYAKSG